MTEHESLRDTIERGFYRKLTSGGKIILTNGKVIFNFTNFANIYQHFECDRRGKFLHLLNDLPNEEPFPLVEFIIDFSKPYGKIDNEPYLNIKPDISYCESLGCKRCKFKKICVDYKLKEEQRKIEKCM